MQNDTVSQRVASELAEVGYSVVSGVVSPEFVARLAAATDEIVAVEAAHFPPGHGQHGRVLCPPASGGAFLELCGFDPLFAPIEALLGADSILYAMTTSVLEPGSAGPIDRYHVDLAADRPEGIALSALLLLDPFTAENGATEFLEGSHRWGDMPLDDSRAGTIISAGAGDVCYFDPRIHHRTTMNRSAVARRAVPLQVVRPWMKQRFDMPRMLNAIQTDDLPANAQRRLGLTTTPPGSLEEFLDRGVPARYS